MAFAWKADLPIAEILVPTFAIYASVSFDLALELSGYLSLSLSLGISLILPTIALGLALTLELIAMFNIALGLNLPSVNIALSLSISAQLILVLGIIAAINIIVDAVAEVGFLAYGYTGTGAAFGNAVQGEVGGGFPDGTSADAPMTAYVFAATSPGSITKEQVKSVSLLVGPPGPPTPPPQAYEWGLATVSFPSSLSPLTYPADPATGTLTIDNSVTTGIGAITSVNVTHSGSGYTSNAYVMISDTVNIVSSTVASPIVVTLPNPLSIAIGTGIGLTIAGVMGNTTVQDASNATPIVITVASTANLKSCTITGAMGNQAVNGQWFTKVLTGTTAALYQDQEFMVPSSGTGTYTARTGTLTGNINGLATAKLLTTTTAALYEPPVDPSGPAFVTPIVGYGTYRGGTVTGGGVGAVATSVMGGGSFAALAGLLGGLLFPSEGIAGGEITFAAAMPLVFNLFADLLGNLKLQASLLASAKLNFGFVPPTITASIQLLLSISANLKANLAVKLPSLTASLGVALSGQIQIIASLFAQIGFMLGLSSTGAELEIYEYQGSAAGLGPAINAAIAGAGWHDGTPPETPVVAALFGLTSEASVTAFTTFFAGV